jgi:predicted ATPase/DNA-binding SARP family transcriptional activator
MAVMRFRLLGRLELVSANGAVVPPGAVSRAIVGRLLLAHGAVVQRDTLVDELWEDRGTKNPVGALQVQMAKLRTAFAAQGEEDRLLFGHGGYRIVLGPGDEVDVPAFEAAVREGREHLAAEEYQKAESTLRLGLSMWRGRALDGLRGRVFETERTRLEDLRLGALEDAATAGLELGRAEELIPELKALLPLAPLRERSRARLMLALYRCGRFAEALEVYETGRRLLKSELGVAPSLELRSLHASILRHEPSLMGHDPSPQAPATLSDRPSSPRTEVPPASVCGEGNLSRPLGPFVGRRKELTALREVVDRERLVTVLGPGGVGKTRLALEVCALVPPSRGTVWWVDLAPADDANVLAVVASALGLSDTAVRPDQPPHDYVHRLTSFLAGRSAVLVLDNCEHLLDAVAPLVATLLGRCPSLTVLTTSRAPLEVPAEVLYPLAPMPDEEAADLFGARAAMIDPSFAPDAVALHDIRRLCRRLDGLPLAVELAAAHVRLLTVREIEARLDNRFTLLIKGERTAPARHRTLRAVLDWSYALLDTTEQRVLTELALYVGGCSLELMEAAMPLPGADSAELLHVLGQLVDKSLLVPVSTPDGNRLRMLETVREYALTRLREEGRAPEAEERLMTWAARLVREGSEGISSRDQREWARRLTEESANIRAASDLMMARSRLPRPCAGGTAGLLLVHQRSRGRGNRPTPTQSSGLRRDGGTADRGAHRGGRVGTVLHDRLAHLAQSRRRTSHGGQFLRGAAQGGVAVREEPRPRRPGPLLRRAPRDAQRARRRGGTLRRGGGRRGGHGIPLGPGGPPDELVDLLPAARGHRGCPQPRSDRGVGVTRGRRRLRPGLLAHPLRRRGRERRPARPGLASSGPKRPGSSVPSGRVPAGRMCCSGWSAWTSPRNSSPWPSSGSRT